MEVIAATRLRRYEERALRFRPYLAAQRNIAANLSLRLKKINSFWTEPLAEDKKGLAILISSDRGFCGAFNNQLFESIKEFEDGEINSFIAIGKKGALYLKKQHFSLIEESALPQANQMPDFLRRLTEKIISSYRQEGRKVRLIFNKFRRNLLGRGRVRQIFPLEVPKEEGLILDYLFEPDTETLLDEILPVYVHTELKAAILESQAAEEMARMVAMTQARRNAGDLIEALTLEYHKARQAGITRELIEVVSAIR